MQHKESSFTTFSRSAIILLALVAIPLSAVCLKMFPTDRSGIWDVARKSVAMVSPKTNEPVAAPLDYRAETEEMDTDLAISINEDYVSAYGLSSGEHQPTDIGWEPAFVEIPENEYPTDYTTATYNMPPGSDEIAKLQTVLEERFGATEFKLRPWGNGGDMYICSCYIALSDHATIAKKHFQTFDSDTLKAVQKLIDDIQAWKTTH